MSVEIKLTAPFHSKLYQQINAGLEAGLDGDAGVTIEVSVPQIKPVSTADKSSVMVGAGTPDHSSNANPFGRHFKFDICKDMAAEMSGKSAPNAAVQEETAGIAATEDDQDTQLDPVRSAQFDHLGEAVSSSSSKLWQREQLLLEHMRSNPGADLSIGIRTVINGGFIVVATSADFNTKPDELVCCSTPAELLSAIALLCGFAEHG